jgi:KUP system potassium uptake protein
MPLFGTALGALGVVFGDIGTSPLYAVNACFHSFLGIPVTPENILGILSCIFWSLTFVIGVKYALFIMKADDDGEGGVFALLGLLLRLGDKPQARAKWVVLIAACGAALLYGDGVITPAMSVVSAIEGLEMVDPDLGQYVVIISVIILLGLFSVQRFGTGPVGKVFGPAMVVWFVSIGILGAFGIAKNPEILHAVNPLAAVRFFGAQPAHAFLALGGVVLCITGGEALYADLGHFSRRSIRLAWYGLVWPSLLLNYFGQGANLLLHPTSIEHSFFALVPKALLIPSIIIATLAAIIASQAIITGAFSLTRQGMRLGLLPRFAVKHVSQEMEGRIYLAKVNLLMGFMTLLVVLIFKTSGAMAGAYGIAVTAVMGTTSVLFGLVMRHVWKWSWWRVVPIVATFLFFDLSFFFANVFKIPSGGWFPIGLALAIAIAMLTWRAGRETIDKKLRAKVVTLEEFARQLPTEKPIRSPGVGIYPTSDPEHLPGALIKANQHMKVVPEVICVVSMVQSFVPRTSKSTVTKIADNFWLVVSHYGYMQNPRVLRAVALAQKDGLNVDLHSEDTTYYLSRERVEIANHNKGPAKMMGWRKRLFMSLSRGAAPMSDYFGLPGERVMEIGVPEEI